VLKSVSPTATNFLRGRNPKSCKLVLCSGRIAFLEFDVCDDIAVM